MQKADTGTGTSLSEKELKFITKQNEAHISKLQHSITTKRKQLQDLSQSITKIIEKKIIYKKNGQTQYKHPNFHPKYQDPELNYFLNLKNQLYKEIDDYRQKISMVKGSQENAVVNQLYRKKNILKNLEQEQTKVKQQKQYLEGTMEANKTILEGYKKNQCILDIEANTKELQELKKQIKKMDRQWNEMNAEEIQSNLQIYELQKEIEKIQNPKPIQPGDQPVNPLIIKDLIDQIQQLISKRNGYEKKSLHQISSIKRNISNLLSENVDIEKKIRHLESEKMKQELEHRHQREQRQKIQKMKRIKQQEQERLKQRIQNLQKSIPQSFKRSYHSIFLNNGHKQPIENNSQSKEDNDEKKDTLFLTNTNAKMETQKQIIVGQWIPDNAIDDIQSIPLPPSNNDKNVGTATATPIATNIKAIIENRQESQKIKQILVTYVDGVGIEHVTRGINGKEAIDESNNQTKYETQEINIDLTEVEDLRYMPESSKEVGMKWVMKDGRVIEIGQFSEESANQIMDLQKYCIIQLDFCLDETLSFISGLLFKLKPQSRKQNKRKTNNSELVKWRSTSDVSLLTKKIFVKPSPYNKRNSDLTKVDHRLLLNKKKK